MATQMTGTCANPVEAISYLAEVLQATKTGVLNGQHSAYDFDTSDSEALTPEGNVLNEFLLARIASDGLTVGPYARALLAMENLGKWDQTTAARVMSA